MSMLREFRTLYRLALVSLLTISPYGSANALDDAVKDVRTEILVGKSLLDRIYEHHSLFHHEVLEGYVSRVGRTLAAHAGRPEIRFQFAVLDNDTFGTYAVPGGYIFITRGALNSLTDEAELAAVLAHEMAHVIKKHLLHDLHSLIDDRLDLGAAPSAVTSARFYKAATAQASEKGYGILFDSGFPLEQELEADRLGARLLAEAGYDPSALHDHIARLRDRSEVSADAANRKTEILDQRLSFIDGILANPPYPKTKQSNLRQAAPRIARAEPL